MNDGLEFYNRFNGWTERTGIMDGSGLTWIVRIPLNLIVIIVSLIIWLSKRGTKKEVHNG